MFLALLKKNRKRKMATPEETRDRIKEMRDRIFNDSDKNSIENKIQETAQDNDLAEKKSKVLQTTGDLSSSANLENSQKASSSEKFQQYDDRISILSADTKKQISEIGLEFTSKLGSLETEILEKLEQTFEQNNSKINGIEDLVSNSNVSLSQANEYLKEELQKLNRALQLEIGSVSQRLSSADQKIETELQKNTEKLSNFEKSFEERQRTLEDTFYEKVQQNADRISLSNADAHKKISEISFNVETELKNNSVKLSNFEKSVEERQSGLEDTFYEKVQQNADRISLLSEDTQRQISEIADEFANKNSSLETEMLDKLEHTSAESKSKINEIEQIVSDSFISSSQENKALKERLDELNRSLQMDISSVAKRLSSANETIETELKNNSDKLSNFEKSVEERQSGLEDTFYEKVQQNADRISLLSADTQRQFSEIAREFANKSSSLETEMLGKLEHTSAESKSKINEIEQIVSDSVIISSQENKALKERLDELNRSLEMDISSVAKRLSSANETIETKLKNNSDKLSNFEKSVEERQSTLEDNFYEKVQQNADRISLLSADTQRQVSEIAREFANKSSSLETEMLDNFEHISFHLKKVEEQIENQISDLSTSVQKYVLSLTDSQEDKIDAQAKKIEKNVSSLKREIFEYKRELKADIDKRIKESELKTNDYLSKKIYEVRDLLSGEFKSLSGELSILKGVVKEKNSELAKLMKNNVSSIKKVAEKDRKHFNNRFEKVSESVQSVEAMIVKEDDLLELFQNYTLNVNISDDVKS